MILHTECDDNWHNPNNVTQSCDYFAKHKWCKQTGDHYGENWKSGWGQFEKYADAHGRTAFVCPQCGCGGLSKLQYKPVCKLSRALHEKTAVSDSVVFLSFNHFVSLYVIFSHVQATLHLDMSVGPSISPSVPFLKS